MARHILAARGRGRALVAAATVAAFGMAAHAASAESLNCGSINPHAVVLAAEQGQAQAQAEEARDHALPWSTDLGQQAGQSNAHKRIEAECADNGKSITVRIAASEWGDVQRSRTNANPSAMAGWAPVWTAHVAVPPGRRLDISVASGVSYLTCQLVAPGVAMTWSTPFHDDEHATGGATNLDVTISCTSGGLHNINPALANDWVNGETILVNLAVGG
jgi:hypothetical protein